MTNAERFLEGGALPHAGALNKMTAEVISEKQQAVAEEELKVYTKFIRNAVKNGLYDCEICFGGYGCDAKYNQFTIDLLKEKGYTVVPSTFEQNGATSKSIIISW